MISEIDIWRAAQLMLKRYGHKALEESATRADGLAAGGDHDGADTWRDTAGEINWSGSFDKFAMGSTTIDGRRVLGSMASVTASAAVMTGGKATTAAALIAYTRTGLSIFLALSFPCF